MVQLTIDIPATKAQRILDGVCGHRGYQATITDAEGNETPNPETQVQFVKKEIVKFLKDNTIVYERNQARETEDQTSKEEIEAISIT